MMTACGQNDGVVEWVEFGRWVGLDGEIHPESRDLKLIGWSTGVHKIETATRAVIFSTEKQGALVPWASIMRRSDHEANAPRRAMVLRYVSALADGIGRGLVLCYLERVPEPRQNRDSKRAVFFLLADSSIPKGPPGAEFKALCRAIVEHRTARALTREAQEPLSADELMDAHHDKWSSGVPAPPLTPVAGQPNAYVAQGEPELPELLFALLREVRNVLRDSSLRVWKDALTRGLAVGGNPVADDFAFFARCPRANEHDKPALPIRSARISQSSDQRPHVKPSVVPHPEPYSPSCPGPSPQKNDDQRTRVGARPLRTTQWPGRQLVGPALVGLLGFALGWMANSAAVDIRSSRAEPTPSLRPNLRPSWWALLEGGEHTPAVGHAIESALDTTWQFEFADRRNELMVHLHISGEQHELARMTPRIVDPRSMERGLALFATEPGLDTSPTEAERYLVDRLAETAGRELVAVAFANASDCRQAKAAATANLKRASEWLHKAVQPDTRIEKVVVGGLRRPFPGHNLGHAMDEVVLVVPKALASAYVRDQLLPCPTDRGPIVLADEPAAATAPD